MVKGFTLRARLFIDVVHVEGMCLPSHTRYFVTGSVSLHFISCRALLDSMIVLVQNVMANDDGAIPGESESTDGLIDQYRRYYTTASRLGSESRWFCFRAQCAVPISRRDTRAPKMEREFSVRSARRKSIVVSFKTTRTTACFRGHSYR